MIYNLFDFGGMFGFFSLGQACLAWDGPFTRASQSGSVPPKARKLRAVIFEVALCGLCPVHPIATAMLPLRGKSSAKMAEWFLLVNDGFKIVGDYCAQNWSDTLIAECVCCCVNNLIAVSSPLFIRACLIASLISVGGIMDAFRSDEDASERLRTFCCFYGIRMHPKAAFANSDCISI